MKSPAITVWFDSACPLCSREIRLMRALDWRHAVHFVDIHSDSAACPLDPALLLARFHAQNSAGDLVSGAEAFALMWRQIPLFWPLGQIARIPLVLNLLERAYFRFLAWRNQRQS
jgi:predicted DCC family thiol-disulfide oxidoreductase YuxK